MRSGTAFSIKGMHFLVAALVLLSLFVGSIGSVQASGGNSGAVYTMTNSATGNEIQVYERAEDGRLTPGGSFATGGFGTGSGLGSQGAIVLGQGLLFAVNAGSNELSAFDIDGNQLNLVDKASSQGTRPISITYHDGLLYVLNAGNGGNIAGFRVSKNGHLAFIRGSVRPLSNNGVGDAPSPEEIGFSPNGRQLVVSEKGSNLIDTYDVVGGWAFGPIVNPSAGPAPYGFDFAKGNILVISEAANSAVSTYRTTAKGLNVISASLVDTQAAACWLVVTSDGRYAYAANAASGTVSGYRVHNNGELSLLRADGINANTGSGSHPIDMGLSKGNNFLYVLTSGNNLINEFTANPDGNLSAIGTVSAPAGATGLAAH
ncbi:MAG TPA: beta-propeller fold lactonase family protein [Anaerolineaceae bacterium]|nr:beta-propeller fold lactonase family protein [Anaerolineaceae bacterium]